VPPSKAQRFEQQLDVLRAIRAAPDEHDLAAELTPFFRSKSAMLIGKAAGVAEQNPTPALESELVKAFEWLIAEAPSRDRGCIALPSVVRALVTMEAHTTGVYLRGYKHVQIEGSFGPPVDAAAGLRACCIQALAQLGHPDALNLAIDLLTDAWPEARQGAVRALAASARVEAESVLRLKALYGDKESGIVAECMSALLTLNRRSTMPFVARFLTGSDEEVAEAAALALGETRSHEAFELLRDTWNANPRTPIAHAMLVAIGTLRLEEALALLLDILENTLSKTTADSALRALEIYSHDPAVATRIDKALAARPSL
jgi:HEAT repeat protein